MPELEDQLRAFARALDEASEPVVVEPGPMLEPSSMRRPRGLRAVVGAVAAAAMLAVAVIWLVTTRRSDDPVVAAGPSTTSVQSTMGPTTSIGGTPMGTVVVRVRTIPMNFEGIDLGVRAEHDGEVVAESVLSFGALEEDRSMSLEVPRGPVSLVVALSFGQGGGPAPIDFEKGCRTDIRNTEGETLLSLDWKSGCLAVVDEKPPPAGVAAEVMGIYDCRPGQIGRIAGRFHIPEDGSMMVRAFLGDVSLGETSMLDAKADEWVIFSIVLNLNRVGSHGKTAQLRLADAANPDYPPLAVSEVPLEVPPGVEVSCE